MNLDRTAMPPEPIPDVGPIRCGYCDQPMRLTKTGIEHADRDAEERCNAFGRYDDTPEEKQFAPVEWDSDILAEPQP